MTVAVLFGWRAERHPDNAYLRGWQDFVWPMLGYLLDEGSERLRSRLRVVADQPDASRR